MVKSLPFIAYQGLVKSEASFTLKASWSRPVPAEERTSVAKHAATSASPSGPAAAVSARI